jgi:hypothetical protein
VDSGAHQRAPTGGDGGRRGAALSCARANVRREECVGRRAGLKACMHARWLGRLWPGALGAARGHRDGVSTVRASRRQRARAGVRARGRGPSHVDRRVVHTVTTYGWRAMWARRGAPARRRRCDVVRIARSGAPARFQFAVPLFDRSKLKNFELKFKIAKYESCRPDNPLQLS